MASPPLDTPVDKSSDQPVTPASLPDGDAAVTPGDADVTPTMARPSAEEPTVIMSAGAVPAQSPSTPLPERGQPNEAAIEAAMERVRLARLRLFEASNRRSAKAERRIRIAETMQELNEAITTARADLEAASAALRDLLGDAQQE
jgi:hypothetical protein